MSREPVAEIGAEDYRIVRHTHDIELATQLMREHLVREWDFDVESYGIGKPRLAWIRIIPALPNSDAAAMGWKFEYRDVSGPGRGVFPAVVFS